MERADICARVGAIEQLAGIREVRESATGMRLIEIDNGLMQLTVLADRGFDVGTVRCYGHHDGYLSAYRYSGLFAGTVDATPD